jgi:predicted nucleic acid-binding protein
LVDTGPLVAIFDPEDEHHDVCVQALAGLPVPLYSCWPVITEAAWLLRYSPSAIRQLLGIVETGFLALLELEGSEAKSMAALMEKYAGIRPQLADVALVHLAGREGCDTIFTLDRRDFSLYRTGRGRSFRILPQL